MLNIAKIWAAIIGFFVLSTLVFTEVAKADICNQSDYVVTNISGTTVDYGDTQWPVKTIVFSDAFGSRTLGENYDFHRGIDLKGEEGDAVYSIADGVVTKVQEDCDPGSSDCPYAKGGKVVVIKHSLPEGVQFLLEGRSFSKYYSVYQHLQDFNTDNGKLQEEQQVNKGSRIGSLGRTGATYAHLHLETRVGTTCSGESQIRGSCKPFGAKIIDPSVNPLYFLNEQSRAYVNDNNYQVCVTKNPQVNVEFFSPRTELDFNEIEVVYNGGTKIINFSRKTGINLAFVDKNPYDGVQIIPSDFRSSTPQYIIKFDFQNLTDFEEINIRDIWGNGKKIVPVTSPISTPR
jgi:murein DD-endopeptidase MepM/ murein hydrolase activator NlpD